MSIIISISLLINVSCGYLTNREALAELDLPIVVKGGSLGRLSLTIPWQQIKSKPAVIRLEKIFLVAAPKEAKEVDSIPSRSCPTISLLTIIINDHFSIHYSLMSLKKSVNNTRNASESLSRKCLQSPQVVFLLSISLYH